LLFAFWPHDRQIADLFHPREVAYV